MKKDTDLCIELLMDVGATSPEGEGYVSTVSKTDSSVTTIIDVKDERGEQTFGKPKGRYVTVEVPPFSKDGEVADDRLEAVSKEIKALIPENGSVLVVGLGNRDITADALGPLVMSQILATRHLKGNVQSGIGLDDLRDVSGIIPGVLGQTGIEVSDIVKSVAELVKPVAVITIDALAAREINRLGCTVQITDAGVAPGSGVGNGRPELSLATLGIPVIGIGVPTVISVRSVLVAGSNDDSQIREEMPEQFANLIVTPKEIDLLVQRAAKLIALSINSALFPEFSTADIISLVC